MAARRIAFGRSLLVGAVTLAGCGSGGDATSSPTRTPTTIATPALTKAAQVRQVAYKFVTAVSDGNADRACKMMRAAGPACHELFYRAHPRNYVPPVIDVHVRGLSATASLPVGGYVRLRHDADPGGAWWVTDARMPRGSGNLP